MPNAIKDEIERIEEAIRGNNLTIRYLTETKQYDRALQFEKYNDIHQKRLRYLRRETKRHKVGR